MTHALATIRVASVPSSHVYVRHLSPLVQHDGVERLPEPTASDGRGQAPWWPPAMLTADWVREHHDELDVFHIHFGFDARTPAQLRELVATLAEHGKPLVLTVHDLRNPHQVDRAVHDALLDVLVPSAAALITLTPGAADEVERRWGRRPLVVPHPHVVPLDEMAARQAARVRTLDGSAFRIGLHVKSVRAGMDPSVVLPALVEAADQIEGAVVQVNGHHELLDRSGARYDPDVADLLRSYGDRIDCRVHPYFDDDELWTYLASLDVSVLPYRFGTHSGWLEACRDLGTAVIAPSCGYYAQQGPVAGYHLDEEGFDAQSLVDAVHRVHRERPAPARVAERERQRADIAATHQRLYASLL